MNSIVFLILRRMRLPLLVLSAVYAIATFGLTIIPGVDDQGQVWYMDFFHAFYFVTFMGTTIGFGEIPYPFTDAQRMWALIFIYITVATWIYAIGALINLLQNDTLKKAVNEYQFKQQVVTMYEPFYVVCGYGDTGSNLVDALLHEFIPATVIDIKQDRIDTLTLTDYPLPVPGLCANAADPENLIMAGATHPLCAGIVALTNNNLANLHIAITAKVLNSGIKVICRADSHDIEANLDSFGTDHIVDPFDTFATQFGLSIHAPHQYLLSRWFHNDRAEPLTELVMVPKGKWVLCGYGRFGRALYQEMVRLGLTVQVIEPNNKMGNLPAGTIRGLGTEAVTLNQAGISDAVGIVAGADDDSNNLSIIVTARALNPNLFVVARRAENYNHPLFLSPAIDVVMAPSEVLVNKIRSLLTNPLVDDFLSLARTHDDAWARDLCEQIRQLSGKSLPEVWPVTIDESAAGAVMYRLAQGGKVELRHLLVDHRDRRTQLDAIVLLSSTRQGAFCMPEPDSELNAGDELLFIGTSASASLMKWNLRNDVALSYVVTGRVEPQTMIGRWFANRFRSAAHAG